MSAFKDLWINLPVKDLGRSKAFFAKLGFVFHPRHEGRDDAAALVVGEQKVIVMLVPESTFQSYTGNEISDTSRGNEVLVSLGVNSKEEVDEILRNAVEAGGSVHGKPNDQGWLYGANFIDLDGHRWNLLYMDMSKAPAEF
ncbi:VOC family protein [Paenibacillus sp. LHD-117]|uniref:VOC family protein n=1 Tax=Paenibacillus sp. LHD-117 TaxID=3071412 RepID=UPI0027E06DD4|nr:VOC family protein [Paenibacillus sp. LHD-117]MDQ6420615.1 VOC family protein [Paenibacillus sp. LHD-117]